MRKKVLVFLVGSLIFTILFWVFLPEKAFEKMKAAQEYERKMKPIFDSLGICFIDTADAYNNSYDPRTNVFTVHAHFYGPEVYASDEIKVQVWQGQDYRKIGEKIWDSLLVVGLVCTEEYKYYKFIKFIARKR